MIVFYIEISLPKCITPYIWGITLQTTIVQQINLCAMIFSTINDFPTYENLSGYSVKGHHTCLICEKDTSYIQLKHGKNSIYKASKISETLSPVSTTKESIKWNIRY